MVFSLVAILWGASYAAQKTLLVFIDPVVFTFWNFFLSGLVFFFYAIVRGSPLTYRWKEGVVLGLFLSGVEIFQMVGLNMTSSANTAFLTNLGMLIIPFVGWFLFKNVLKVTDVVILGVAIIGMYLLVGGVSGFGPGDGIVLLSAFASALYFLYSERFEAEKDGHITSLCVQQFFTIALVCFVWGLFANTSFVIPSSLHTEFLWQIIIFTTIPYGIIQWACIYADGMTAALYDGVVEPLVGAIFSWVIFLEATSATKMMGAVIMLIAFVSPVIFTRKRRHFLQHLFAIR